MEETKNHVPKAIERIESLEQLAKSLEEAADKDRASFSSGFKMVSNEIHILKESIRSILETLQAMIM